MTTRQQLKDFYLENLCSIITKEVKVTAQGYFDKYSHTHDVFEIQDENALKKLVELLKKEFPDSDIRYFNKRLLRQGPEERHKNFYSIVVDWA